MKINVPSALFELVVGPLRSRNTEQVAFLFLQSEGDDLAARDVYLVPPEELVYESRFHAEVSEEGQAKIIKSAADRKFLLAEIHSHPGCALGTEFSPSDLAGFRDFVPYIFWRLRSKRYAALVFGDSDFDALAWVDDPSEPVALDGLLVDGRELRPTSITIGELERQRRDAERYSRQTAMFGREGQELLATSSVAIAGVGGLGCHIVQQLAYAGVKLYFLIDPDRVDRSNLNRFIIATEQDLGRLKVDVAREYIERVQPGAEVHVVAESLLSPNGFDACSTAGFIFGCLDVSDHLKT